MSPGAYGVGRQAVHARLRRYTAEGLGGLVDREKPDCQPEVDYDKRSVCRAYTRT